MQELTQLISMEEAQEAALKAANIEVNDANISATTLNELVGAFIYKVEFTAGEYAYAYSINAETGVVMEMISQELNDTTASSPAQAQTEAIPSTTAAPTQSLTDTGKVDEAVAQKIALDYAGVNAADVRKTVIDRITGATERDIYEWEFDYDDGRPEYEGKITYGGVEYEFTIDATNGSVVEWDVETVR